MFKFRAPAAIKVGETIHRLVTSPPHERSASEVFNSNAFVLEPSRQLFFDMLAKVGSIDSVELVDNVTINTDRMFLTGYFDSWSIIPNSQVQVVRDIVVSLIPEVTNRRIRRVIKSMPPFSDDTVLDFSQLTVGGIHANLRIKPWMPSWRIPCAWECRFRKHHHLYEALMDEWWRYYYDLMDVAVPPERSSFALVPHHDPSDRFQNQDYKFCLPFNCGVPDDFTITNQRGRLYELRGSSSTGGAKALCRVHGQLGNAAAQITTQPSQEPQGAVGDEP
eukprot:scaffold2045_cov404-Prasinococcus_capsulatus_cf.AAC.18